MLSSEWFTILQTEFRANWIPCDGRCSDTLHRGQTYDHVICKSLDHCREDLKGCAFTLDVDMQEGMAQWFRWQPRNSLQMGYANLCVNGTIV